MKLTLILLLCLSCLVAESLQYKLHHKIHSKTLHAHKMKENELNLDGDKVKFFQEDFENFAAADFEPGSAIQCEAGRVKQESLNQDENASDDFKKDDLIYKTIYCEMSKWAQKFQEREVDEEKRRRENLNLPDYFPTKQIQGALQELKKHKNEGFMKYPTLPYRFCLFPYYSSSAMSYCQQTYSAISEKRINDCNTIMCLTCCDNSLLVLQNAARRSDITSISSIANEADGVCKLQTIFDLDNINKCRELCQKEYPMELPKGLPRASQDPELGKSKEKPAMSCMDIKVWGKDATDGTYFVKTATSQEPVEVYCDMETDGGGWTLFYNYKHGANENIDLNGEALPKDPESANSHQSLTSAGFTEAQVSELRFYCHSQKGAESTAVHFKSNDAGLLQTALTGSQETLNAGFGTKGVTHLPPDTQSGLDAFPESVDWVNNKPNGGFFDTPFGQENNRYWTIKGSQPDFAKWECGDSLNQEDGSKYATLHQVWFRGPAPDETAAKKRAQEQAEAQA